MRRKVIKAICSLLVVTLWGVSPVYAEETDNQQQETTKEAAQETEKTVEEGEGTVETDETIQPTPSTAPEGEETEKKDTDTVDEVEKKDDVDETVEVTENEATKVDAPEESVEDEAYTVDEEDIMTLSAPEPSVANNTTLTYCAHVQDYGWMNPVTSNQVAGTTGQNKRLEGLKITLTDELANHYDIYYRAHVGNIGWLGWTKNGGIAGSVGCNRRIEAVQIAIYAKNDPNAPKVGNSQTTSVENPQYTPTYYSQRDPRWAGATYNGYNLQSTGCVPTAVAMVVDGILHNGVTPNIMADYLVTTGEFAGRKHGGSGLAIRYGAEHWGLKTTGIGDYGTLVNCLNAGNIVVFQVGAGTFTSRGSTHAIVLFRNSGGNTYVYDPWNAHNGWYSISMIWNQRSTNSYDLTGGYVGYGIYQ